MLAEHTEHRSHEALVMTLGAEETHCALPDAIPLCYFNFLGPYLYICRLEGTDCNAHTLKWKLYMLFSG